jgi:hypothetical protein
MSALIANFLMATQLRRSAHLNCRHHFALFIGHGMALPVFVTILTENVGNLI